jgi:hypothetical protein
VNAGGTNAGEITCNGVVTLPKSSVKIGAPNEPPQVCAENLLRNNKNKSKKILTFYKSISLSYFETIKIVFLN